ncbi:MAG: S-methyl-5-thioribose-1-phosphate isomerase [candidate division KSB1 bacterium]|nr:S-methyl-5-thioribose-1-phosphate isomerase [candidate division KSB1 bacterium]MDZ7385053.1 S-methyl-5-thioribose-1-phosphate isomerase [candidate division KSB1 bacterium]
MKIRALEWIDGKLRIIDQTKLPGELVYLDLDTYEGVAEAIERLRIRGAPAIGVAAAFGVVLAAQKVPPSERARFFEEIDRAINRLKETRPTGVNLSWALHRMRAVVGRNPSRLVSEITRMLVREAQAIMEEDRKMCERIGRHGAALLPEQVRVLTHCNAGALATAGYGTALGVLYAAREMRKRVTVYVDETRPLLQGARLTAWELLHEGFDVTLICDATAAFLMQQKRVDCVLVGADRIAANGDVANKVGTYNLAVAAHYHGIPFYVAAPSSTVDLETPTGAEIPIEERNAEEVVAGFGVQTAPREIRVYNPAFDVTPHALVSAIITEKGVLTPPFAEKLRNSA